MNGLLTRMEVLVAGVLLLLFLLWAGSRCKETKTKLQAEIHPTPITDTIPQPKSAATDPTAPSDLLAEALRKKKEEQATAEVAAIKSDSLNATPTSSAVPKPGTPQPVTATKPVAAPAANRLYVTIDKLKIRTEPGLKSKVLGELPLFSEVYFMDETTDSIYTLSLGKALAHEPYIKVKTKKGTIGWVYGAGVNFYKKKQEGVLE